MRRALLVANEMVEPHQAITLYKNNSDGKGNSYGTHENYLVSREVEFNHLVRAMVPHFVSRQIIIGAGKVGAETEAGLDGDPFFQLSSRAEFFEEVVGLETTLKRPIINTRDEPHADAERFRRLHVIIGDANMSQVATFVKLGSTALVARGVGGLRPRGLSGDAATAGRRRAGLRARSRASSTPCCARTTANGPRGTSRTNCGTSRTTTWSARAPTPWPRPRRSSWCFASGARCSTACATTRRRWPTGSTGWPNCGSFGAFRSATASAHGDARLHAIDLQYHDLRPERSLAQRVGLRALHGEDEVREAVHNPPEETRAYFRGQCVARYPDEIVAANWDSVVFDLGEGPLQRVPMLDPLRGTRVLTEELLETSATAHALLDALDR